MLPPHRGGKYLFSPRWVMAIEVPQNKEISGGGKDGGKKRSLKMYEYVYAHVGNK